MLKILIEISIWMIIKILKKRSLLKSNQELKKMILVFHILIMDTIIILDMKKESNTQFIVEKRGNFPPQKKYLLM